MQMMKKTICITAGMILLLGITCAKLCAEEYDLGNVLVSATKTEQYQSEVGSSTTVITNDQLRNSGKVSISEVLQDIPGLSLRSNSVYGGVASLDIRGAKSGQTMVMIDGVEIYDPIAIDRDFDFAHLTTDNVEKIEVVRGPQSSLYGANAMAGIINIITKKGQGKQKIHYSLEGGSFDTFRESLGISAGSDTLNYSVLASRIDSDGVSKARNDAEKDGYKNTTVSANLGANILDGGEIFCLSRYTDAEFDIDDTFPASHDDVNRVNFSKQFMAKTGVRQWLNENWDHEISFSYINMDRRDRDPSDATDTTEEDDSRFRGDVKKVQWQHNISLSDKDIQSLGFDYQQERGASFANTSFFTSQFDRRSLQNRGYFLQTQVNPSGNLFTSAAVRIDDHDIFGSETTYRFATSYIFKETDTRFKASYGTAFKAPSIYQLYDSTNGNENLKAEKSKGFDTGIEQNLFDRKAMLGVTYFNNKYEDLISWTPDFPEAWTGMYTNIKEAYTAGLETEARLNVAENLTIQANYTYTATKDKNTGKEFGRRPRHQAAIGTNWDYSSRGNAYLGGRFVGGRFDDDNNTKKIKKYFIFDLATSYDITKDVEIFWRIENIFDRDYELIRGFDGLERSIYTGIKGEF